MSVSQRKFLSSRGGVRFGYLPTLGIQSNRDMRESRERSLSYHYIRRRHRRGLPAYLLTYTHCPLTQARERDTREEFTKARKFGGRKRGDKNMEEKGKKSNKTLLDSIDIVKCTKNYHLIALQKELPEHISIVILGALLPGKNCYRLESQNIGCCIYTFDVQTLREGITTAATFTPTARPFSLQGRNHHSNNRLCRYGISHEAAQSGCLVHSNMS